MQGKLVHANRMAALGLMVSNVAHDINNPNNTIMFNLKILSDALKDLEPVLDRYYREHGEFTLSGIPYSSARKAFPKLLDAIGDSSYSIKRIVSDLRQYIRDEKEIVGKELQVSEIVGTALTLLQNQISTSVGTVEMQIEEPLLTIRGNYHQLVQAVANILQNALESFSGEKEKIVVTVLRGSKNRVLIKVRDEGTGMSKEVIRSAVEPFFTTRQEQGGTGLGLTISNAIIEDHKGSLKILSRPGKGTTVTISLPAA